MFSKSKIVPIDSHRADDLVREADEDVNRILFGKQQKKSFPRVSKSRSNIGTNAYAHIGRGSTGTRDPRRTPIARKTSYSKSNDRIDENIPEDDDEKEEVYEYNDFDEMFGEYYDDQYYGYDAETGGEVEAEGEGEEVKFSHEVEDEDSKQKQNLTALSSQFQILSQQVTEFKNRLIKTTEKLKEAEIKKNSLEDQTFALEEENLLLKQKLNEFMENQKLGLNNRKKYNLLITGGGRRGSTLASDERKGLELARVLRAYDDIDEIISYDEIFKQSNLWALLKLWYARYVPFKSDIRQVEGKLGSSVASYFLFQRFIFIQFGLIVFLMLPFAIVHSIEVITSNNSSQFYNSEGLQPNFMMYSSFTVSESSFYSFAILGTILICLVIGIEKLIREDKLRKTLDSLEAGNSYPFAKEVLCAWDFSNNITAEENMDHSSSITHLLLQLLEESKTKGEQKVRSQSTKLILIMRRMIGLLLYLAVQFSSFIIIVYLSINSDAFSRYIRNIPLLKNFSSLLTSVVLNVINYLTPSILRSITTFEQWDFGQTEVNMLLFRMYLSNLLNTIILAFSYILLANPIFLANDPIWRERLEVSLSSTFQCRLDQTADGLFVLMISNAFLQLTTPFVVEFGKQIVTKYTKFNFKKGEFDIATKLVSMLDLVGMSLLCFPFSPISILMLPIIFAIKMKSEKFFMIRYVLKPKRPWKSQKAGQVFTFFYMITLVLIGIPTSMTFMSSKTFQKSCNIQDEYIGLCLDEVTYTSSGIATCTIDTSSSYYALYGQGTGDNTYPNILCSTACGPYIREASAFSPIREIIQGNSVLVIIYDILFSYPYIPWFLASILMIYVAMETNTIRVSYSKHESVEKVLETKILTLEAETAKQAKIISRLKALDATQVTPTVN